MKWATVRAIMVAAGALRSGRNVAIATEDIHPVGVMHSRGSGGTVNPLTGVGPADQRPVETSRVGTLGGNRWRQH